MADEDGYENFDLNQADIDHALNPGRRRHMTKDQATYGIWADEDSDDDIRKPSYGKKKADYTSKVSFVSGGVKVGEKIVADKNGVDEITIEKEIIVEKTKLRPPPPKIKKPSIGGNVFAGMRKSTTSGAPDHTSFGGWTKGGKGDIVKNMMAKMGYKWGEGLGKDGTGIVEPVQAQVRQGRGAVGAYGKEAVGPRFGESAAEAQKRIAAETSGTYSVEDEQEKPVKRSWKKAEKTKVRYKTIDDVIEEGGRLPSTVAKNDIKIIDMTGPERREYRGYDSFTLKTRADADDQDRNNFDIPELRHNLNLLTDLAEQEIRRTTNQSRTLKNQSQALSYDLTQLKTLLDQELQESIRLKEIYELIESFNQNTSNSTMSEIQSFFLRLRTEFGQEYRLFNLEQIAIPLALPLVRNYFKNWNPLMKGKATYGIDVINEWKEILNETDKSLFSTNLHNLDQISAYDRILWEAWIPALRRAALLWDPRDQMEEMLVVLENWLPTLPSWMKENVLEQIIIPRINDRVSNWDPLTDVIPVHAWIIPWLELLGDRLQPVLSQIRQKLARIIRDKWNPSDISAQAMLKPWINVWTTSTMSAFIGQHILPKLERFIDTMNIEPHEFREEDWKAAMAWLGMINPDIIVNILIRYFFPRWISILVTWVKSPHAQLGEVRSWFKSWNDRIPPTLREFPTVKESMRHGLIAMNQAATGQRILSTMPPPPLMQAAPPPPLIRDVRAAPQQLSLKDIVEMQAVRSGLTYVPQPGRMREGRQVYWFGSVSIYLDKGMVFCMDPHDFTWRPITMDELLPLAGAGV